MFSCFNINHVGLLCLFLQQYHNFGDLIRLSMNKCRENNTIGWYKTVITCLKELYLQLKSEEADYSSVAWTELKELAKKFALSLGFDAKKVRQPLVGIHRYRLASSPGLRERGRPGDEARYRQGTGGLKSALTACNPLSVSWGVPLYTRCGYCSCREGIVFSMSRETKRSGPVDHSKPPPHLDFLFILVEFSHRLLVVDRCGDKGVLPFLTKQLPEGRFKKIQEEKPASWEPLITYYQVTRPNKGGVAFSAGNKGKKRPLKGESALGRLRSMEVSRVPFFISQEGKVG